MTPDQERTIVIASTRTAFHAEAIAAALRERGVDARVLDANTSVAWGNLNVEPANGGVKVVVLERDKEAAERALEATRVESESIDWDAVDLGEEPGVQKVVQMSRSRRWAWTLALLLVPAGLFILAFGVQRGDPVLKTIGGVLLLAAMVIVLVQVLPGRG